MYLTDFIHLDPPYALHQEEFLSWLASLHPSAQDVIERVCCKKEKIAKRYLAVPQLENQGDFGKRGAYFQTFCDAIFESFYPPNHIPSAELIHVTCTGYNAPSSAQVLVSKRGWEKMTRVTHAYHMGCLAALPAIRMGRGFLALGQIDVDIVHTELCSLHFHPSLDTAEQFVALSLFADGLIKYSLKTTLQGPSLRILAQHEEIVPQTEKMMKWESEAWGFKMTLAKEIPVMISRFIVSFIDQLAGKYSLENAYFAVHPGGPKIIELVAKKLNLSKKQLSASERILYNRGNMSSATLPHIWEEILNNDDYEPGSLIVGLAFGPGLTISGILLEKVL